MKIGEIIKGRNPKKKQYVENVSCSDEYFTSEICDWPDKE